jgi:hypothetical protein
LEATVFLRQKHSGGWTYLQVVESRWEGGRTRQRVIATLGRLDRLIESGELDGLIESAARFSESLMVLSARSRGTAPEVATRKIGPDLVFGRLWRDTCCQSVLESMLTTREFQFDVERAVYLTVLHRLVPSGPMMRSDRAALGTWRDEFAIPGTEDLALHHMYRAMGWLGEVLPDDEQAGRTPFSPRTTKDEIEERLFAERRDLFTSLDLVFFDTTSIYFEGDGGQSLGRRGHSKDRRPDHNQMIVGLVLDSEGYPVCCEMWPGNTTDVKALVPIVDRMRERFHVGRVCIVADRGMVSSRTVDELEERGWLYILGARMRTVEVRDEVLSRAGRYREVRPARNDSRDPAPLKVKDVVVDDRRYVVCLNEEEKETDAESRERIVESLRRKLKQGDKALIGNKGYRRFLTTRGKRFAIDTKAIQREARYDGRWVLRTNTDLDAAEVALRYKQLWTVEEMFRTSKSLLETRPIYHKCDETIRGHVFCTFLALTLRKALQVKLEANDFDFEWGQVIHDLESLTETEVRPQNKTYLLRSTALRTCGSVCKAVGVALPATMRLVPTEVTA